MALAVTALVVDSPPAPERLFANDPQAQRDLVRLLVAGERARYLVEFTTTRSLPDGESRAEPVVEAQIPPRRVVAGASTATIDFGSARTRCTVTDVGAQCLPESSAPDTALATSRVYDAALTAGVYAVRRAPSRTVAGETAACFELVALTGVLPHLGLVAERCLAHDGVPLADRAATASVDDQRTAVFVRRDVDRDDLAALLDRFVSDP